MKKDAFKSFLKELVVECLLAETIIANDDIRDIKGKIVESVQVNDTAVVLHFDDDSKFTIQTDAPDAKITYQYHRGMIKPNSTGGDGFNTTATPTTS